MSEHHLVAHSEESLGELQVLSLYFSTKQI